MPTCPDCDGKGYKEFEHGLIRLRCDRCKGTGNVGDDRQAIKRDDQIIREPNPGKPRKRKQRTPRKADAKVNR